MFAYIIANSPLLNLYINLTTSTSRARNGNHPTCETQAFELPKASSGDTAKDGVTKALQDTVGKGQTLTDS